jgi:hypothetical protein
MIFLLVEAEKTAREKKLGVVGRQRPHAAVGMEKAAKGEKKENESDSMKGNIMKRYVFANPRFKSLVGCIDYLLHLMEECNGRYRHTNTVNDVDSILFVYEGRFVGEIPIKRVVDPKPADIEHWPPTRKVYLAKSKPRLFRKLFVSARSVGLTGLQYGKEVSNKVYTTIIQKTEGFADLPE